MVSYAKRPKSRPRRRPRRGKKMSFETRVLLAMRSKAEKKVAKAPSISNVMSNQITDANVYPLMPAIRQGDSAHGERIGNKINLLKLTIKGYMVIPSNAATTGNGARLARLMILRQRNQSGSQITLDPTEFDFNRLMEYDQPYVGSPNNWLQSINKQSFVSRRDKKFKLFTSANAQGNAPEVPQPDSIRFFSITLTFGKQGKTLTYADDASVRSEQFPYFMVAAIHEPDGTSSQGTNLLNYYTEATYTDL